MTLTRERKISLTAGLFYLLTFVSIPTLAMYGPVKEASYLLGAGADTTTIVAGLLEIIVAIAGIGSAVALFPMLKRQSEAGALGLVASRILEASTMFVGVAFILAIEVLRQEGVGAEGLVVSQTMVALHNKIFLLGQSFLPAVSDFILGILLYQSRFVPRALAIVGIVGAPLLLAGYLAMIFGLVGRLSPLAGLSAMPVALFELTLGIWLVVKGFNQSALKAL